MSKYKIRYGINHGCYEFVDNEELSSFDSLIEAVQAFKKLVENPSVINFVPYDEEVEAWDLQPGDYQYGESYGGQINLYVNNDYLLLHVWLERDLESKATWCGKYEYGDEITDEERSALRKLI